MKLLKLNNMEIIDSLLQLLKNYKIPLWIVLLLTLPLYFVKLTPLFDFLHKIKQDKKEDKRKNFKAILETAGDLLLKQEMCLNSVESLKQDRTMENIKKCSSIFDAYFHTISDICDGVTQNLIANSSNIKNIVNNIMECQFNEKDNMITKIYGILESTYKDNNLKLPNLRISEYQNIFKVYKLQFPLHRRLIAVFYKPILNIK